MSRTCSKTKRIPREEEQGESCVREIRTHSLVDEVNPIIHNSLRIRGFTLIERVPMRRMFLIDRKESIPPIVQFGRIA